MIPLGKKAFARGKIKRGNEILAHLGADHYAWRTAKQASDIAQRQMKSEAAGSFVDADAK